jgi:hypothetical protein
MGKAKNIREDGGFIGAAAVDFMGHKYTDDMMNTLAQFRDAYMAKHPEGSKEIEWYYKHSPQIMNELSNNPNGKQIANKIYTDFVRPAYESIKKGRIEQAHKYLKAMVAFIRKTTNLAEGGMANEYAIGGLSDLGGYSDGGRLLRGPGDGVSDSIPATIGRKQPARLADGEFVIPARIVSEIGNGSTEAGARKLYAMMDRIQRARAKTVGKGKIAKNTRTEKYLPA